MAKEAKLAEHLKGETQERVQSFQKVLEKLQNEFKFTLYAANQVLENGEVVPIIKLRDTLELKK